MKRRARLCFVVAAAAGLLALISPAANATFPGRDGRIVVSEVQSHGAQVRQALFTMNPNGSVDRQVTKPPWGTFDSNPHWSPDGSTIVFERDYPDGTSDIYTVAADGTSLKQLTSCSTDPNCALNATPAWTPDGKAIVFSHCCVSGNGGGLVGLYSMSAADGSDVQQLTLNPDINWGDFGPTVSPDGQWVAFSRMIGATPGNGDQSISALFLVRLDGSDLHQITSYDQMVEAPDWSPDGSRIVFVSHAGSNTGPPRSDLFSVASDGSDLTQLTHTTPGQTFAASPSWAPSGARIMFGLVNPDYSEQIYTIRPDGSGRQPVKPAPGPYRDLDWGSASPVPNPCVVPKATGKPLSLARQSIRAHDCTLGNVRHLSSRVKKGRVISQDPRPGSRLKHGAKVNLVVSAGTR